MLAILATLKIKPGTEAEFEATALALVAQVNAHEPGCKLYTLARAPEPLTYVFIERYLDEAALEAHRGTEHYRDLGRKMGAFLDGRPEVKRLIEV